MPKVTNIFTGFSTVCGDTMAEKKDPGKFTVRFNICDPQHKAVVDLLNQQGRSKAQFLTNAVLHYINCTEAPELHIPTVPDKKFLEEQILAILAEHSWHVEKNTVELQIQANHEPECKDASLINTADLEQWFGGQDGMSTILNSLQMFEQNNATTDVVGLSTFSGKLEITSQQMLSPCQHES